MKKFLLITCLFIYAGHSMAAIECREAVVQGYESLGLKISAFSFSSAKFEDFNLTVKEFNKLPAQEQERIYTLIRPLEVMVQETINMINGKINRIAGTFYEYMYLDELEEMRKSRDQLRACI